MTTSILVDLTHTLSSALSVYPGSDYPVIKNISVFEHDGYREKQLVLSTHHGTHIDCPFHLLSDGFHTGDAPPDRFFGRGLVADCRSLTPAASITIDFLQAIKAELARIDFLLFLTGMDRLWNTPLYAGPFPTLTSDAAGFLTGLNLKGIGIDALSIDPVGDTKLAVHKTLLSGNIIIIENLTGLEKLLNKNFLFCCFPLKIEEGDGSPVRACAIIQTFESGH